MSFFYALFVVYMILILQGGRIIKRNNHYGDNLYYDWYNHLPNSQ